MTEDLSNDYQAHVAEREATTGVNEMEQWLREAPQPATVSDPADPASQRPAPAPVLRRPGTGPLGGPEVEESTAGAIVGNIGEVIPAAAKGVNEAVMNATPFIAPLADWLDANVADLTVKYDQPKTAAGNMSKGIAQFLTGFVPLMKGMKAMGAAGKVAPPMIAGAISDFMTRTGSEGRLADLWVEAGLPKNVLTDYLATDKDDPELEGRVKNAIEGAGIGVIGEGLFAAARGLRAMRKVSKAAGNEQAALEGKYGKLSDEEFDRLIGDNTQPVVQTKVVAQHPAGKKVVEAAEDTAKFTPRSIIRRRRRTQVEEPTIQDPADLHTPLSIEETTSAKARLKELGAEMKPLAAKEGLTATEAAQFKKLSAEATELRFKLQKPLAADKLKSAAERKSTLEPDVIAVAHADLMRSKAVYTRISEAAAGVAYNADTAIDAVMAGKDKAVSPRMLYEAFDKTREALRAKHGDTITLYRAVGKQKDKPTTNWASTPEFARQFGDDIVSKQVKVDDVLAVNVGPSGNYHEFIVGTPPPKTMAAVRVVEEDFDISINFNRIDEPDQVKFAIGKMAEAMKDNIDEATRGVITQKETAALADDLGMTVPDLLARRKGQPFNAEEALAARNLWAASGSRLLELAKKAAGPNAGPLDQFEFRKAMAVHSAIQSEVIGARTETARALASWKISAKGRTEQLRAIDQTLTAMGGPNESKEIARRLAILAEHGDPKAIAKFVERGWGARTADAVKEAWVNGLLTNPMTHAVNVSSNLLVAFQSIYERGAAMGIRQFTGGEGVAPGEATAMAYGLVESLKDAFKLSAKALKTGETSLGFNKTDIRPNSISSEAFRIAKETGAGRAVDFLGATMRVPSRLLQAEDEFFKTIGYRMELRAQSLRTASQEGHKGKDLARRVEELVNDPPEHIRVNAADAAMYNTFTNEMGSFGKAVMKLRDIDHPLNPMIFILPFVRTPVNIARYAFERTPFAPLVSQWRADIAAGGARADLALSRMATGTAIMTVAMDLADSGLITGAGPKNDDKDVAEALQRQGIPPYSFKSGDRWFSYNRADPLGMTLGFAASIAEAVRKGEIDEDDVDEWNEVVAMSIAAVSQVTISKTYLEGFSKFVEVMTDPQRHTQRYVDDLAASFVPFTGLMSAIKNVDDPIMRESNNPTEAIMARIAGLSKSLPPRRNLWGDPLTKESGLGKMYDFIVPLASRQPVDSPIDRELVRLNEGPLRITKKTSFDGVRANFKKFPQAYDSYVKLAGNELKHPAWGMGARDYLNAVVTGKHPMSTTYNILSDESRKEFIKSTISDYRKLAQRQLMQDPKHRDFSMEVERLRLREQLSKQPVLGAQ